LDQTSVAVMPYDVNQQVCVISDDDRFMYQFGGL